MSKVLTRDDLWSMQDSVVRALVAAAHHLSCRPGDIPIALLDALAFDMLLAGESWSSFESIVDSAVRGESFESSYDWQESVQELANYFEHREELEGAYKKAIDLFFYAMFAVFRDPEVGISVRRNLNSFNWVLAYRLVREREVSTDDFEELVCRIAKNLPVDLPSSCLRAADRVRDYIERIQADPTLFIN